MGFGANQYRGNSALGFTAREVNQYHNRNTKGIVETVTIYLYYSVCRAYGGSWELKELLPLGFTAHEVNQYHNRNTKGIVETVTIYLYYSGRRAYGGFTAHEVNQYHNCSTRGILRLLPFISFTASFELMVNRGSWRLNIYTPMASASAFRGVISIYITQERWEDG
ncbi:hypothetical protein CDAR_595651, partial [Caerostris darwini]